MSARGEKQFRAAVRESEQRNAPMAVWSEDAARPIADLPAIDLDAVPANYREVGADPEARTFSDLDSEYLWARVRPRDTRFSTIPFYFERVS